MCGIAGIVRVGRRETAETLRRDAEAMASALRHRGPDDEGVWVDVEAGVALGHTRLAILDLSDGGHQPMISADGRFVLAFNGEIYNFAAMRAELSRSGLRFRGTSDTEVLVEAIARWGMEPTLRRCDGMFAFAAWDRTRRQLTLARDRFGEKPLYVGRSTNGVVFGSELKALERDDGFEATVDRRALEAYLRFGYVPAPACIYARVLKVPPATTVAIDEQGNVGAPHAYWSLDEHVDGTRRPATDIDAILDDLDHVLRASVAERMVADVPLGAFLSGGVDSSLIVALMQAQASRPVETFTIGVPFEGYDESADAAEVARHLGTDHTKVDVSADDALQLVHGLPDIYDEPFADSSQIPTLLVSSVARRRVKVALSGDGGDELFGGYVRYLLAQSVWGRLSRVPYPVRQTAASLLTSAPDVLVQRLGAWSGLNRPQEKRQKAVDVLGQRDLGGVYHRLVSTWPDAASLVAGARGGEQDARTWTVPSGRSALQFMMATDAVTYLPDDILTKVDRASMHYGLEVRVPFLDPGVVAFAWSLPDELKVRGATTKWLLRKLLTRYVPSDLFERPKMGFAVPVGRWLRGPLRTWADELLDEERLRAEGFLRPAPVRRAWTEHLGGQRDHEMRLWTVLMFQAWLQRRVREPGALAA